MEMKNPLPDHLSPVWFEQFLGWRVERVFEDVFYRKDTLNSLARISLETRDPGVPSQVILKRTFPDSSVQPYPDDLYPHKIEREYQAYQLLPALGVPAAQVYYSAIDPITQENMILMEDLTLSMRIYPPEHTWSFSEMQSILETYACFHAAGLIAGERQALRDQYSWLVSPQFWLDASLFKRTVETLLRSPVAAGNLAGCETTFAVMNDLIEPLKQFIAGQPETFNYNDFFPGNVAVPIEPGPGRPARLFDWHCIGAGMPQNDLLNVLWGWSLDNPDVRDAAVQFYLDQLNPRVGTMFDLPWAKDGILVAHGIDLYQALGRLANLLPEVEQGKARLPGWMKDQLVELQHGEVDRLVGQVRGVLS